MKQKRPAVLTTAIAICALNAVANVAVIATTVPAPVIYAGAGMALIGVIGGFGLWRFQRWGALVSAGVLALSALLAAPGIVSASTPVLAAIASAVVLLDVAGIVLILLPVSRRSYGLRPGQAPAAESVVPDPMTATSSIAEGRGSSAGRVLHQARVVAFFGLSGLLTVFLSFELFAHFMLPTPVVTDWASGHHVHAIFHAVLTAILIPAVAAGLHRRTRRIAALQGLLLVPVLGLIVSLIAWRGFHDLAFPVFNFMLYGAVALIVAGLHPDRGRLFTAGALDPRLAAVAGLAFIPLAIYAASEVAKQLSNAEPVHAVSGHFALTGAVAIAILGLAGLAALQAEGWRLLLWASGLALISLGIGSAALPSEASSFGLGGGLLAIAWGATFIGLGLQSGRESGLWWSRASTATVSSTDQ